MRRIMCCVLILALTFLSGCISYDLSRKVVQQGNLLPQSKIERLHVGMSKESVAALMGTSLMEPVFNTDRWDYAYSWRKGSGPLMVRTVVIYFSHGMVSRIEHRD